MTLLEMPQSQTLPDPPSPAAEWPWQAPREALEAAPALPANTAWPRITVITPSYNQAAFLEKTLRSVLLQNYPNLEYLVFDGGSTDASPAIINKYRASLTFAEIAKDRGQSHAINKGLARATGDVICWLNSDDYFTPHALHTVGRLFATRPDVHAVVGHVRSLSDDGHSLLLSGDYKNYNRLVAYWKSYQMPQPAIFWRKKIQDAVGPLNESMHLIMDYDLWLRIGNLTNFTPVDQILACAHAHDAAKTGHDFSKYHRAQFARVFPRYAFPLTPARVPLACSLYFHLAKTAARMLLRKPTIYQRRYWVGDR